jgi:hypothetical protein
MGEELMNTELLLIVKKKILAHPDKFNMNEWCGTSKCIAGWAVSLSGKKMRRSNGTGEEYLPNKKKAASLLGITLDQADRLFFICNWPDAFFYMDGEEAENAAKRIDHFILTDGAE